MRRLHCLIVDLETEPPASRQLVVWWDTGYRFARPARRDKKWWDVGPGDRLLIRGKWKTVTAVRPYHAVPVRRLGLAGRTVLTHTATRRAHRQKALFLPEATMMQFILGSLIYLLLLTATSIGAEPAVTFKDQTGTLGLKIPNSAACWADFNNDGDLDLVTAGRLFVNQGAGNNWLKVRLHGDGSRVNRSAVGAQVRITVDDQTLTRQVEAGTGEGNQNDLTLHFGLGKHEGPVSLQILWPGRIRQTIANAKINHRHDITLRHSP